MRINFFSGARRMAILTALAATIGTLIRLATYDPYVSVTYTIDRPEGELLKIQGGCPSSAVSNGFYKATRAGNDVYVTLCLLAMEFGQDKEELIPYKTDEKGVIWGAASYSSEVSKYKRRLAGGFAFPARDDELLEREISERYRESWISGLGYLAFGLFVFAVSVWAVGWVVRGFMGVPQGSDYRSNEDAVK